MFCLVPATLAALVLGVPPAAAQLTLQSVGLSCSDGTALNLAVSPTDLLDLSGAVVAISSFPAGNPPLACSLSQDAPGSGNPHYDYAVGGGQVQWSGCFQPTNFALSAHVEDTDEPSPTTSGGTFNLTCPPFFVFPGGHLVAKPDCLHVEGNVAQLSATVTYSDGSFSSFSVGSEIYVEAQDNPDMIGWNGDTGLPSEPCDACPATMPLLHGNVSVHDADCPGCVGTPCIPTTTTTTTTLPTGTTTTTLPSCSGVEGFSCTCGDGKTECSFSTQTCPNVVTCAGDQFACIEFCNVVGGGPGDCSTTQCADCTTHQPCQ